MQPNKKNTPRQPQARSPQNLSQQSLDDHQYQYFRDQQGRLKRFRKQDSNSTRTGYIRFRFLQKYYIWWKRRTFDFKIAILPWFVGFFGVYVIYQFSMIWSQNDLERQIKSKLPFQYNKEVVEQMKRLKKQADANK